MGNKGSTYCFPEYVRPGSQSYRQSSVACRWSGSYGIPALYFHQEATGAALLSLDRIERLFSLFCVSSLLCEMGRRHRRLLNSLTRGFG